MAQVEIYKLKKTVHEQVRDFSVFDYMSKGAAPDPAHYVKEWAGEMHGALPLTIPGRLMLEPPKDYYGGDIKNGDIAVVNGTAYFMDHESGAKFVEVNCDVSGARQAQHPKYGWFVDINGAETITDELAAVCVDHGIPCGYLGEQGRGGVYNDNRPFLPGASDGTNLNFLHPEFMKGEEAREFIALLTELSGAEQWAHVSAFLYERYPINMDDLREARKQLAPELLLPAELRPLHKVIPNDADRAELEYLTVRIQGMGKDFREVFDAVIETGQHCDSIAEIINLTFEDNLNRFDLLPLFTEEDYGGFLIDYRTDELAVHFDLLLNSDDPEIQKFAQHLDMLEKHADRAAFGREALQNGNGILTSKGVLSGGDDLKALYCELKDIPAEQHSPAIHIPNIQETDTKPIMVHNTDLAALLLEMHAVGGDYMRDAAYNVKCLVNKGDDFFIMANDGMLTITLVDLVFRRDTHESEAWMLASKSADARSFVISVTDRSNGRITGNLFEADLDALQNYVREYSFHFTHLEAEMKDGTSRMISGDEWDAMKYERDQVKSWKKYYDPADEARLATYLDVMRWAVEENRQPVAAGEFLSEINRQFMLRADNPQPDMLRVAPEAAKEILAQGAADVFRLMPDDMEKLSPIDAIKVPAYQYCREFAVRRSDCAGIEKWAQRASGEMLRQNERGQQDKSKHKWEEL